MFFESLMIRFPFLVEL